MKLAPANPRRLVARCYREAARLNLRAYRRERRAGVTRESREDRRLAALLAHAAKALEGHT